MKRLLLFLWLFGLLSNLSLMANVADEDDPAAEILRNRIIELDNSISEKQNQLVKFKKSWYDICVRYLKKDPSSFKKEDLESLYTQTDEEIDGEALKSELKKAMDLMKEYKYTPIPEPSDTVVTNTKKSKKKSSSSNSPEKKDNKEEINQAPVEETVKKPVDGKVSDGETKDTVVKTPPVQQTPKDTSDDNDSKNAESHENGDADAKKNKHEEKKTVKNDKSNMNNMEKSSNKGKDGNVINA